MSGDRAGQVPQRRPTGGSLANRITLAVVGITAGVVLCASAALWFSLRAVLIAEVDRELRSRAERMQRFERGTPWRPRSERPPEPERTAERPAAEKPPPDRPAAEKPASERTSATPERESRRHLQVFAPDGRLLASSSGLPPGTDLRHTAAVDTIALADGRRLRTLRVPLARIPAGLEPAQPDDRPPGGVQAVLGQELTAIDAELGRMLMTLGGLSAAATAFALLAALGLRRAILRPLRALADEIVRLGPQDLAARVLGASAPRELTTVVDRLNVLLGELESAFAREQATIAAIAHELRTPVAGLRAEIEFRRMAATDPEEIATLDALLATTERMQAMVGNVLLLARLEAGRERPETARVDLAGHLAEAVDRWAGRIASRGLDLDCAIAERVEVATSPVHLGIILDNLLGNAASHAAAGTPIRLRLAVDGGRAVIELANACPPGIDAARLGTPFYRGDAARSDGDHSGLGLALVRRICALLGIALELHADDGRFAARIALPTA